MIEILPIKHLTDEDAPVFGSLNVALGKLQGANFPVANGIVITAPDFHLKTAFEHFDFGLASQRSGHKEIFEQSLTLVKKELEKISVPENLKIETKKHRKFLVNSQVVTSLQQLWHILLFNWIEQIKQRLWKDGFYPGITEGLDSQVIIFIKSLNKPNPPDLKKISDLEKLANKKLFLTHKYEWIIDNGVKLIKVLPYTPSVIPEQAGIYTNSARSDLVKTISAVKAFLDLSKGLVIEHDVDGIYIQAEKIPDWEELVFKIVESATTFFSNPVLVKFSNKFDTQIEALDFVRHKKGLLNAHIVTPLVRTSQELAQIKRDLAVKKLLRKNSLQIWMSVETPENIINLEDYLLAGIDGVVLNLDEMIGYLVGFDHRQEETAFYKKEVSGLLKFLEDKLKLLHKSKVPFLAFGSICLEKEVLEFLVQKGVYGIVFEKYEVSGARDLLHQTETKHILSLGIS